MTSNLLGGNRPEELVHEDIIPQRQVDFVRRAIDSATSSDEFSRIPDNMQKFCISDPAEFNTMDYFEAVYHLALGGIESCFLDQDDLTRYERRVRLEAYGGVHAYSECNSLHDALLLRVGKERRCFDMAGFTRKFPKWKGNIIKK